MKKRGKSQRKPDAQPQQLAPSKPYGVFGIPRLHLSEEVKRSRIGEELLGVKSNQAVRGIKEVSGRIFRTASQRMNWLTKTHESAQLSKEDQSSTTLTAALLGNDTRVELLAIHQDMVLKGESPAKLERIPILEYRLLSQWRTELASLQKGEQHPDFLEGVTPGALDRFLLTEYYQFVVESKASGLIFQPKFLIPVAERLVLDFKSWDSEGDEVRAKLAGAAYAIASAFCSYRFLGLMVDTYPELSEYLEGVKNVHGVEGADIDEDALFDFFFSDSEMFVVQELSELYKAVQDFAASGFETSSVEPIQAAVDKLYGKSEVMAGMMLSNTLEDFQGLSEELSDLKEQMSVSGRDFGVDKAIAVSDKWLDALRHPSVQSNLDIRAEVLDQASAVFSVEARALISCGTEFDAIQESKSAMLSKDLSWEDQFKAMEEVKAQLDDFDVEFTKAVNEFVACELPDIVLLEEKLKASKDEVEEEHSVEQDIEQYQAKAAELEVKVETLEMDLTDRNEQIGELRKENGELKLRLQTMEQALNGSGALKSPVPARSEALVTAVEAMVEEMTPATVLRVLEDLFSDSIRVLDSAYKSASEHENLISVTSMFHKVRLLASEGMAVLRETGRLIDMKDVVPGNLSLQESETVRNSAKLRSLREFKDGDKTRVMFPHLSVDYRTRLHFEFCPEEDRIIIGYVGKHLPTAKHATT